MRKPRPATVSNGKPAEDQQELLRLGDMLLAIDKGLPPSSALREALLKAGIALSLGFIAGMRPDIERQYGLLGQPLTHAERANLESMGINPDAEEE